jgi:ABC-type multidrug transport system ATPase subunit
MLRPDSGEIQVLGQSMDGSCAKLKEQIGYVADEPCFPECLTPNQLGAVLGNVYAAGIRHPIKRCSSALNCRQPKHPVPFPEA